MVNSLFFEIKNDCGVKIEISATFFKTIKGSWKKIPGNRRRSRKTVEDIKAGDLVVYIGRESSYKYINKAHSATRGLTPLKKYKVLRVIDFSDEEKHQNFITESIIARGW